MAFVGIAGFAQPSFELSWALKLLRLCILLLSAFLGWLGFGLGLLLGFVLLLTTKPLSGGSYLYPLIPFDGKALLNLLLRKPISRKNT